MVNRNHDVHRGERCLKCVTPRTYPGITFDRNGVCSFCRKSERLEKQEHPSDEALHTYLTAPRRKSRKHKYDCVVLLSGGKDSTYSLYYCKAILDVKPLAVTFDNAFMSPDALRNISNATSILRVDSVQYRPSWKSLKELYRAFLLGRGEFCSVCNVGVLAAGELAANTYNIPFIIKSHSPYEVFSSAMGKHFKTGIDEFEALAKKYGVARKHMEGFRRGGCAAETINLPNYVEWNDARIRRTLKTELGWASPPNKEFHFDCEMFQAANHLLVSKYGCGELTDTYSIMVRTGEITRKKALTRIISEEGLKEPRVLSELEKILDVTFVKDVSGAVKKVKPNS